MTPPLDRRITAPVSLAVAALVVVVMGMWGMNALTAPFEDDDTTSTGASTTCGSGQKNVLRRGDVTVSVYNAGKRKGRAGATLDRLERAGFRPGAVGNAPKGLSVRVAEVHTKKKVHPDATLVARALGKRIPVVVTDEDLGPGVDVFIGDRFRKLDGTAPRSVRIPASASC